METFAPDFPILPAGDSPSLSFSEMLNQTSSNFEYNVNSVSVSPTPCSFIDSDTSELVTKRDQTFVSCKIHFFVQSSELISPNTTSSSSSSSSQSSPLSEPTQKYNQYSYMYQDQHQQPVYDVSRDFLKKVTPDKHFRT